MSCYGDVSIQRSHLINKIRGDFELDIVLILIKAPSLKIYRYTHVAYVYIYICHSFHDISAHVAVFQRVPGRLFEANSVGCQSEPCLDICAVVN